MRRWTIWLLLLLPMPCWADAIAAFNDGKNLGNAVNPQNLGAISAGSIQDKLPAYGQSVAETGYFQGGHGDTISPGAGKVSLCATATPDSNPIRRQECDAVNFLARNPGYVLEHGRELFPHLHDFFTESGMFRSWPHRHDGMDGFCAARLRRIS